MIPAPFPAIWDCIKWDSCKRIYHVPCGKIHFLNGIIQTGCEMPQASGKRAGDFTKQAGISENRREDFAKKGRGF